MKKRKLNTRLLALLLWFVMSQAPAGAATYYVRVTGLWNALTTWSTVGCGSTIATVLPGPADDVIVCGGNTLTVNINATVNSITILNNGIMQNGGASTTNRSVTVAGTLNVNNGGTLIQNSILNAATTLFSGTEIFGTSSTFTVTNWSGVTQPLITNVSSGFGNVNLNWNTGLLYWNNQGLGFTRAINGNFSVGAACMTWLDSTANAVSISLPGSLTVNGRLRIKQAQPGAVTLTVGGACTLGSAGNFTGNFQGSGGFIFSAASVSSPAGSFFYGAEQGTGNVNVVVSGNWNHSGTCNGLFNTSALNSGVASFTVGSLNMNGGFFAVQNAHNTGGQANLIIGTNAIFALPNASDRVIISGPEAIGVSPSTVRLNFTAGNNVTVSGNASAEFRTSDACGEESISINGIFSTTSANTFFNGGPSDASGHKVTASLGGLVMSGGKVWLSENSADSALISVTGAVTLSGGTLCLKSGTGFARLITNGGFTQNNVASVMFMHGPDRFGNSVNNTSPVLLTVNGSFLQSAGVLHFDSFDSQSDQTITINGPSYEITNTALMTRAGAGTSNHFGRIRFVYPGTTTYFRNLNHGIRQCRQVIENACTLDVLSGPLQVSSHQNPRLDLFTVESGATLSVRTHQLTSDTLYANSGITVADGGRFRLSRTDGLYNGFTTAAISSAGSMNYFLGANSIVEYNTATYARLTGINVGIANAAQHKYGILEINHTGPAGTWVSPTFLPTFSNAVYIRTQLRITAGELNLCDAAGNPSGGGRTITLENGAGSALLRTGGYIRSEATDHSGRLAWNIGANIGAHLVPFGYSATEYIPLTYNLSSGNAGTVFFSTYRTPASNLPWPSGVTNLASHIGLTPDNRSATVDRFWRMSNTGSNPVLQLTFNYIASEIPGIPFNVPGLIRAHAWNAATNAWMAAVPGQTATPYQVIVPNAPGHANWALASQNAALPVELIHFSALQKGSEVELKWTTASEKNNSHFIIERSYDLKTISESGRVEGAGFSSELKNYSWTDTDVEEGQVYYRLRQVDFDGSATWTDWIAVKADREAEPLIYPNPVYGPVFILSGDEPVLVKLMDASGRHAGEWQCPEGGCELDLTSFSPGVYYLQIIGSSQAIQRKLIRSR